MFDDDPRERFRASVARLTEADDALAAMLDAHGLPEYWHRPPGFAALALLILEQQVSLASAAACFRRLSAEIGGMTPEAVLAASPEATRAAGVSRQKDRYLRALAGAITAGDLDLAGLAARHDDEVRAALIALPGIGRWTADTYLLACLDRPDVWPVGDRALQVAVAETLQTETVPSAAELDVFGRRWAPYRSDAARLLWHGYLSRRGRVETPASLLEE